MDAGISQWIPPEADKIVDRKRFETRGERTKQRGRKRAREWVADSGG